MSHRTVGYTWVLDPGEYDIMFKISDQGKMRLVFPLALLTMARTRLTKIFELMCRWEDYEQNREAIRKTRDEIPVLLVRLKHEWDAASTKYQREYKLGRVHAANNKKLLNAVKKAKRDYERMTKVQADFAATLEKFNLRDYLKEA